MMQTIGRFAENVNLSMGKPAAIIQCWIRRCLSRKHMKLRLVKTKRMIESLCKCKEYATLRDSFDRYKMFLENERTREKKQAMIEMNRELEAALIAQSLQTLDTTDRKKPSSRGTVKTPTDGKSKPPTCRYSNLELATPPEEKVKFNKRSDTSKALNKSFDNSNAKISSTASKMKAIGMKVMMAQKKAPNSLNTKVSMMISDTMSVGSHEAVSVDKKEKEMPQQSEGNDSQKMEVPIEIIINGDKHLNPEFEKSVEKYHNNEEILKQDLESDQKKNDQRLSDSYTEENEKPTDITHMQNVTDFQEQEGMEDDHERIFETETNFSQVDELEARNREEFAKRQFDHMDEQSEAIDLYKEEIEEHKATSVVE